MHCMALPLLLTAEGAVAVKQCRLEWCAGQQYLSVELLDEQKDPLSLSKKKREN